MALQVTVNGHDVTLPVGPAQRHEAPIWDLYYEVLTLHGAWPVESIILTGQGQIYTIVITLVGVTPWVLTYVFDDPVNPGFTFEVPLDWRVDRFQATRPFRDKLMVWLSRTTITEASWVFT